MNKDTVIFVSHCIINKSSKVRYYGEKKITQEELNRKEFLSIALKKDICLIQLPCPEFNIYGSDRWGHTKKQFDNPFFRDNCRNMLIPYILQMEEYCKEAEKFNVIGIVGIEGSPSCGINLTCGGNWGGEISSRDNIKEVVEGTFRLNEKGVFMEVLKSMLEEKNLNIPMIGLSEIIEKIK
ncbi:MAG: hypothetical protein E6929_15640 [Clostridium sp.]|nr:hypothetical protein [Clostridium sp.]